MRTVYVASGIGVFCSMSPTRAPPPGIATIALSPWTLGPSVRLNELRAAALRVELSQRGLIPLHEANDRVKVREDLLGDDDVTRSANAGNDLSDVLSDEQPLVPVLL